MSSPTLQSPFEPRARAVMVTARVLVVEDDADTAQGLELCIRAMGHEVHHIANGREALAKARSLAPDLVLLDLGLPGMGGLDVLQRLRVLLPDTPVVVVSAWDEAVFEGAALDAGAALYLEKPITGEHLAQAIEWMLP